MPQDMCPICCAEFKEHDIAVEFLRKAKSGFSESRLAHLDCLLHSSKIEDRKHPPQN